MGDATSKAGQSPVGHTLCTEETAAASRACRGMETGMGIKAEVLPTPCTSQDAGCPEVGSWEGGARVCRGSCLPSPEALGGHLL